MAHPRQRPADSPRPLPTWLRAPVCAAAGAALLVALARGADCTDAAVERDAHLTSLARQALRQDAALAPYNLGVTVRDRVAVLWGPIPSAALARRAEDRARTVAGLLAVRNEFQVDPACAPGEWRMPQRVNEPNPGGRLPERRAPGALTVAPSRAKGVPASAGGSRPARPALTAGRGRFQAPAEGPELTLPAIPVHLPGGSPSAAGAGPLPPRPSPRLEQAVGDLQRRGGRFWGIRAEVRGGLVYLRGPASRSEDLFRMAQAVGDLPGVERVVVQNAPGTGP